MIRKIELGQLRALHAKLAAAHKHLSDVLAEVDAQTTPATEDQRSRGNASSGQKPSMDSARTLSMSEAFPTTRGNKSGLTQEMLDRLSKNRL